MKRYEECANEYYNYSYDEYHYCIDVEGHPGSEDHSGKHECRCGNTW